MRCAVSGAVSGSLSFTYLNARPVIRPVNKVRGGLRAGTTAGARFRRYIQNSAASEVLSGFHDFRVGRQRRATCSAAGQIKIEEAQ